MKKLIFITLLGTVYFFLDRHIFRYFSWQYQFKKYADGYDTLLDVGCGPHSEVQNLKNVKYKVGIDLFAESIETSKRAGIHDKYFLMDVRKLLWKFASDSVHIVVANDLLEHLTKDDGMILLGDMNVLALDRIIVFTPNGFIPQDSYDGNDLQIHKSGWTVKEMRRRGYKVIGIGGWKKLRKEGTLIKGSKDYYYLWEMLSALTQLFTFYFPKQAYHMLCIKDLN